MNKTMNIDIDANKESKLAVVPTIDIVVFPNMLVPLLVLDERIVQGIERSIQESKQILLLAAKTKQETASTISTQDLYSIGTIATIMRVIRLPEGGIKILVQGNTKANVTSIESDTSGLYAQCKKITPIQEADPEEIERYIKEIRDLTKKIAFSEHAFSPDFHLILSKMSDHEKIADFILSHLTLDIETSQKLLETDNIVAFLECIYHHLYREIKESELQEKIKNDARESMNKSQKEYYLREQLRAIKKELGEDDDNDVQDMLDKLATLPIEEDTKAEIRRQINRLDKTSSDSMEASVIRNYLDWIFSLPWGIETEDNTSLDHARMILDQEHYGLDKIKENILDFISLESMKRSGIAPILCFIGPPGTGKTSLGQSIAKSLGRKYARIALGGVKDEAEIRGHRRTYVGAMPGRFIQAIRKAGSMNPLIVIDELDKIGADFRGGDPSSAMLEVLDSQQNKTFYDNYLGIPFDLSKVMFIATANRIDSLSAPLRDRMEIIQLSGYSLEEKIHIAKKHLLTKILRNTGLENYPINISEDLLQSIINHYTRESGVRECERIIKTLCSKIVRSFVEKKTFITINAENIEQFLGPKKFLHGEEELQEHQIGITNALAWTAYGGDILKIEAVLMPGKGKLILTGQLGDVMKESAQAALSYARSHAKTFNISQKLFENNDLHIHIPAGSVPKDGPSAGITMLTSILSAYTKKPINAHYAMTGELNLRGEVMQIGGLREKILAAKRNKIQYVICPDKNKGDLMDMQDITQDIKVILVKHADEVLQHVLLDPITVKQPKISKK
ncbi:MAG: endopeptidase La [Candidatus Babeliales bacterium]